ncbi:hypothetical protein SCB71_14175 [Herbiconiux sp. KACC 21604]|uniref:hypothetical protein n=1 Tax=unclassified Herbiconiux TaxID=2618217 RepID=UPI0014917632|nr:hypothetical protein [Herbiconiux sp. SALV-R1]QJU54290.1 hypothetical protein HL652_12120 [Herbiconiux sp. SALV-R1]WPO85358.1 hypothetical protein SCB71_14175 [Herbiconiux sp. KACC 21604]
MTTASVPHAGAPGAAAKPTKRGFRTFGRRGWAVAVVAAFFYAYHLWGGVANLIGVVSTFSSYGVELSGSVWALVIGYAVVPIVVYLAALFVGRTLTNLGRIVVFAVGFAVVSVISLDILALAN